MSGLLHSGHWGFRGLITSSDDLGDIRYATTFAFYPIWAYWACSTQFLKIAFTTHRYIDAPPCGCWLRALHWWRKVRRERRRTSSVQGRIRTNDLQILRCVLYRCATTASHKLLPFHFSSQNISISKWIERRKMSYAAYALASWNRSGQILTGN